MQWALLGAMTETGLASEWGRLVPVADVQVPVTSYFEIARFPVPCIASDQTTHPCAETYNEVLVATTPFSPQAMMPLRILAEPKRVTESSVSSALSWGQLDSNLE